MESALFISILNFKVTINHSIIVYAKNILSGGLTRNGQEFVEDGRAHRESLYNSLNLIFNPQSTEFKKLLPQCVACVSSLPIHSDL